jgi:hypothetical protein
MNPENSQRYKKLQEKFSLPHLKELREKFKIEVEDDEKVFDHIRFEVSEKLFMFTDKIIEPLVSGSDYLSCIYEQDMLTDDERVKLFNLYKKIQVLKWENNMIMIKPDEKKAAEWIKKSWDLWNNELESELTELCRRFSSNWHNLKLRSEKTAYHG